MHPELFKIGPITVYTYGFCIAIGLLCAVILFYFLCKKFKISERTFNFYTTTVLIAVIVGFLMAMLFQAVYAWIDSGFKEFSFENGMTFLGGLIGGVGLFLIITAIFAKDEVRRDFWKIANIIAPCIPLAHGFGRIGCFFGGCCYGIASDSPIAVQFPHLPHKVLPTQLFEAAFLFVLFGVMLFLLLKYKRIDLMMLIYLGSYAVWRFIIEFFRSDERYSFVPGLTPSQFQSIVMLLVCGALAFYIYYFDRIPFCGKMKIGRNFREFALAEPAPTETEQPPQSTVEYIESDEAEGGGDAAADIVSDEEKQNPEESPDTGETKTE